MTDNTTHPTDPAAKLGTLTGHLPERTWSLLQGTADGIATVGWAPGSYGLGAEGAFTGASCVAGWINRLAAGPHWVSAADMGYRPLGLAGYAATAAKYALCSWWWAQHGATTPTWQDGPGGPLDTLMCLEYHTICINDDLTDPAEALTWVISVPRAVADLAAGWVLTRAGCTEKAQP